MKSKPFRPITICLVLLVGIVGAGPTLAQSGLLFDGSGNLVRMPFDPDLPVVRSVVRQERGGTWFLTYVATRYDDAVEHYQEHYRLQTELAPGWTLVGYGFDVGADAFMFTLSYQGQRYRLELAPDSDSAHTILRIRSRGAGAATQPYLHSVAPFRPSDMERVEYNDLR